MDKKQRGIDGTNRDYIHYEQVDKDQNYRFAEAESGEEFDESYTIRTCDLDRCLNGGEAGERAFAAELGEALEDIGFAILENPGIDPQIYDAAADKVVELFTRASLADKQRFLAARHGSVNQGYFPIKETSDIHPDLVEGWVFGRRAFAIEPDGELDVAEFWPLPELEPFFRHMCLQHERLILPVIQSVLRYLGEDPHLYDRRMTGTSFALRLNYYPPVSEADDASGAGRLLGHEDVNMFTFLPAPQIEGLQVLNRRNNKWIRLHAPRGSIVLNVGDYLQRITNDRLPSTTHRVSRPRDPEQRRRARVSFPMNVYLWEDETLEVLPGVANPKYEPIKAITFHTRTTSKYYGDAYAVTD